MNLAEKMPDPCRNPRAASPLTARQSTRDLHLQPLIVSNDPMFTNEFDPEFIAGGRLA